MMIEDSLEKRNERTGTIIFLSMVILVIALAIVKQCMIEKKGKYVVGRLTKHSDGGSEVGWIYEFEYYYDNRKMVASFGAPLGSHVIHDSVIFIKLLPDKPGLCEPIRNTRVPSCIKFSSVPRLGWDKIPDCP